MSGAKVVRVKSYTRSKPRKATSPKPKQRYGSQPHQRMPTRAEAARMRASKNRATGGIG